jgi:hypothetical protein
MEGHAIWRTNSGTSLMSALRHGATRDSPSSVKSRPRNGLSTASFSSTGAAESAFLRVAPRRRRTARRCHSEVGSAAGLPRAAGWPVPNPVHGDRWEDLRYGARGTGEPGGEIKARVRGPRLDHRFAARPPQKRFSSALRPAIGAPEHADEDVAGPFRRGWLAGKPWRRPRGRPWRSTTIDASE